MQDFLQRNGVPVLNLFVYTPETHGTSIGPDNRKALLQLTRYLIDLGHRRFGVIAQDSTTNDRARARTQGISDALAEHGLAVRPDHFVIGQWTIREGRELFRRIVSRQPMPTAVICGNGFLAVGAMLESQALGIRVPDDMSIVGYDDLAAARMAEPAITTIAQDTRLAGETLVETLIAKIEDRAPESVLLPVKLVVRGSS